MKMTKETRLIGLTMAKKLIAEIDAKVQRGEYLTRAEFCRSAIAEKLQGGVSA